MRKTFFKAIPFVKEDVTLALEGGVSGLIVEEKDSAAANSLARCEVIADTAVTAITLASREDETTAKKALEANAFVVLQKGWEIIPVENLLAHTEKHAPKTLAQKTAVLALEVSSPAEATLAAGILEKGVEAVVIPPEAAAQAAGIVAALNAGAERIALAEAVVTEITPVGMGHRVCVDTLSRLRTGQGMLVGNSAAFTFLVNAETEHNEYVASRPFRVNAGAVHAYAVMPEDKTSYLEELQSGDDVLIVNEKGETERAVIGRVKVEKRPMLLVKASMENGLEGAVFLQNAETIRLVRPGGEPVSVVSLKTGDTILCRPDTAGRHFGIRITEDITEA
ncbi:MAG: 3-dehydroquinate synthase [Desulfovibrio sp.]